MRDQRRRVLVSGVMLTTTATELRDKILNRRAGQARCPAHADRSPSLSVRIGSDGRLLLHCFAGCTVEAILQACELEFRDLYLSSTRPYQRETPKWRVALEYWRRHRLQGAMALLDHLEELRAIASAAIALDDHLTISKQAISTTHSESFELAWDALWLACLCIPEVKQQIDRLISPNENDHIQAWREERDAEKTP